MDRITLEDGGFINKYSSGQRYKASKECAYFSNHTLNDAGYMVSGNAWNPRGVDVIYNGFEGLDKPKKFNKEDYDKYARQAVQNIYDNFKTRQTLDPDSVYPVNMFYAPSPNKEKAYNEGSNVYGTHTGYLSYDKNDDTWYVTHNIHGTIHKDRFGDLQNSKNNTGVTAIFNPRKNNLYNRVRTRLGFRNGGSLKTAGISDKQYYDIMQNVAKANYKKWGDDSEDAALTRILNDNSYNYRGYYDKYPTSDANAETHWSDEFKTVYHPTFSNESIYSGKKSKYNPKGLTGGRWFGEAFIPAPWQLIDRSK